MQLLLKICCKRTFLMFQLPWNHLCLYVCNLGFHSLPARFLHVKLMSFWRPWLMTKRSTLHLVCELIFSFKSYPFIDFPFTLLQFQLMNLLFSFLEPNRSHSALLAGYFSKVYIKIKLKVLFAWPFCQCGLSDLHDTDFYAVLQVVVCLMIRKTVPLMNYVQVSKTLCFFSTVVVCLFNFMEE